MSDRKVFIVVNTLTSFFRSSFLADWLMGSIVARVRFENLLRHVMGENFVNTLSFLFESVGNKDNHETWD